MHELAITKEIINIILQFVHNNKVKNIKRVVLDVGELTTYKRSPILFYFDILRKESQILRNMDCYVEVDYVPGKAICNSCGSKTIVKDMFICANCGSNDVEIISGKDIKVKTISFE